MKHDQKSETGSKTKSFEKSVVVFQFWGLSYAGLLYSMWLDLTTECSYKPFIFGFWMFSKNSSFQENKNKKEIDFENQLFFLLHQRCTVMSQWHNKTLH